MLSPSDNILPDREEKTLRLEGIYETSDIYGKVELATDSVCLTSCPKLREQANRTTAGDLFPQSMGRS